MFTYAKKPFQTINQLRIQQDLIHQLYTINANPPIFSTFQKILLDYIHAQSAIVVNP